MFPPILTAVYTVVVRSSEYEFPPEVLEDIVAQTMRTAQESD